MNKHDIHLSNHVKKAIDQIVDYIAFVFMNPQTAIRLAEELRDEIHSLERMPSRFAIVDKGKWRTRHIRRMIVKNYYVYYRIDDEQNIVFVVDVISMRRDRTDLSEII